MSDYGRLQEMARDAGLAVNPPSVVAVPAVTPFTPAVGDTLSCTMGEWSGTPTSYAYQWLSDGDAEIGTGASYVAGTTDAGHSLTCVVTASNDMGSTTAPPSNAVMVSEAVVRKTEPAPTESKKK